MHSANYCVEGCSRQVKKARGRCAVCAGMRALAARDRKWHSRAACRGNMDGRAFPSISNRNAKVKGQDRFIAEFCDRCDVKRECRLEGPVLVKAFGWQYVYGVWGGVDWTCRTGEDEVTYRKRVGMR